MLKGSLKGISLKGMLKCSSGARIAVAMVVAAEVATEVAAEVATEVAAVKRAVERAVERVTAGIAVAGTAVVVETVAAPELELAAEAGRRAGEAALVSELKEVPWLACR